MQTENKIGVPAIHHVALALQIQARHRKIPVASADRPRPIQKAHAQRIQKRIAIKFLIANSVAF
jgi:hypothetical protein